MLTKAQWLKKLKRLVPSWVFQREVENEAVFSGMAKVLSSAQENAEDHVSETFIDTGSAEFVELQGDERSIIRLPGETLPTYRNRVKRLTNNSSIPTLKAMVDALLIRGVSTFIEHGDDVGSFYDRDSYYDRNILDFNVPYNAFTILIDFQIPDAVNFYDRDAFYDREFYVGSNVSSLEVFENIINAVNENKCYGTVYRLIERAN